MTNQARRPSLLQAGASSHRRQHERRQHQHAHLHHETREARTGDRAPPADDDSDTASRGSSEDHADNGLRRRQSAGLITEIVQTISVVEMIDSSGSVVNIRTVSSPPLTLVGTTTSSSSSSSSLTTQLSVPNTLGQSSTAAPETSLVSSVAALTSAVSSGSLLANVSATSTLLGHGASSAVTTSQLSSTHLPIAANGTALHTTAFNHNSTAPHHTLFSNSTRSSTTQSFFYNSTTLYSSSTSFSSSASSSSLSSFSSSLSSAQSTTSVDNVVPTNTNGAGPAANGGGAATGTETGGAASTSASSADPTAGPSTSTLVGGVVGGLAGLAVLLVVALYILKWKRRQQMKKGNFLLGDAGDGTRGLIEGGMIGGAAASGRRGGGGGGSDGADGLGGGALADDRRSMTERRLNFLMPGAALAAAAGQKRLLLPGTTAGGAAAAASTTATAGSEAGGSSNGGEPSFYRVSGKKLPSVWQHGGDGYDDPRESFISTSNMSVYRDSQGFFGGAGGPATSPSSRFALGSPMRPESGVMVMQPGPGKIVATTMRVPLSRQGSSNHEDAEPGGLAPPPTGFDPIGRSLASQDGSRGSGSRFTEDVN